MFGALVLVELRGRLCGMWGRMCWMMRGRWMRKVRYMMKMRGGMGDADGGYACASGHGGGDDVR